MSTLIASAAPAGRQVARNTLYNVLGQGMPLLAGLVAIPITANALGAARFGLLGLAWAILGYAAIFDLGLGRATTKFVAQYLGASDRGGLPGVVTVAVASQTALGVIAGAALAALAPLAGAVLHVPPALRVEARGMLLALALCVPFVVLAASLRAVLEAAQRFDLVNLIRTPTSVATFVVPAAAAAMGASLSTIVLLLLVLRAGSCWAAVAVLPRAIPGFRWALRPGWTLLRPLLRYGGWVAVSNAVSPLLVYLERFLLASLAGVTAVAYYTAPYEAVTRLLIVPGALAGALFPAFSAGGAVTATRGDSERALGRPLRFLLLTLAPPVIIVVTCAGPLLTLWLGPTYAARSAAAFAILGLGVLINGIAFVPYTYLLGQSRPDIPAKFHLFELPLYIVAGWVLIRAWGVNGAALAWSLRVTLDTLLLVAAVARRTKVPAAQLFGERGGRAMVAVAGFGAFAAGAAALLGSPGTRLVVVAAASAAFAAVAWVFVLDDVERAGLRRLWV